MNRKRHLIEEIRDCTICKDHLPLGPRPIVSFNQESKILIIGQAPGIKVHENGVPWKDKSGDRLREWTNLSEEQFYDPSFIGIVPMGFCYPGKGKSGDLPPRKECAPAWHSLILDSLEDVQLSLLIGQYAQDYYLDRDTKMTLTQRVKNFKQYLPRFFVLPHPSPRNNIWLKKNSWFEEIVLPDLRQRIKTIINHS